MPQGLQCFDETGKIVVDVTDRQMHLIHTFEISLGSNEYYKDYVYDGIRGGSGNLNNTYK